MIKIKQTVLFAAAVSFVLASGFAFGADEFIITFDDAQYTDYIKFENAAVSSNKDVTITGNSARITIPTNTTAWQTAFVVREGILKPGTEYVLSFDYRWLKESIPYTKIREAQQSPEQFSGLDVFLADAAGNKLKDVISSALCNDHAVDITQPCLVFFTTPPAACALVFKARQKTDLMVDNISLMSAVRYKAAQSALPPFRGGPPTNAGWQPLADFTDEFNGREVDTNKWEISSKGYVPSYNYPKNVTVADGNLRLKVQEEDFTKNPDLKDMPNAKFYEFTLPEIISRKTFRYGYLETSAKLANVTAASAFWLQDSIGKMGTEIDIIEFNGKKNVGSSTIHRAPRAGNQYAPMQSVGIGGVGLASGEAFSDGFHIYALEWDEQEIKAYFDGRMYGRVKNVYNHVPLTLIIDIVFSIARPQTEADYKEFPGVMLVDYVRAWTKESPPLPAASAPMAAAESSNGVIACYHFESATNGIIADETGRYPLALVGGTAKFTNGIAGNAIEFDGAFAAVSEKLKGFACTNGFSVEAWINFKNQWYTCALSADTPGTSDSFQIDSYKPLRKRAIRFINPFAPAPLLESGELNEWTHVVCAYDSATGISSIYTNGEPGATQQGVPRKTLVFVNPFTVGASPKCGGFNYNYFVGSIDELILYSRVLTGDEVKKRYAETRPRPQSK